ncbi:perilipin-3-like isoform X1 [Gopherus flavomarginatus]|uniref:perilipin-3-like isoform X1 n=2 Tax=Gopherus flavomarginatus TaxID=286002 RepID=UPI0021CBB252|nr:perilipin-3-like isoform X1 [Gopherus flavomarginatus]
MLNRGISDYTMASNGKDTTMASPEHGEEEQQNILRRVASLPLVNSACDLAATAYVSTKESHPYVRSICDMAEKGVTSITSAAVSSAQPVVTKLEPEGTTEEECVSEVPDKVEGNLPVLQQTADEATSETQELTSVSLEEVKETMITVVDMTKEAVQDSMKTTKSVVTDSMSTVVESRMGQLAISAMEAVLEKSEELLDHYLPMTDDELAELAESVEGAEISSAQPQEHRSYFVRLGSLSTKLRQRAYRYSLNKMRHTSQSIREALSQLHETMGLIEYLKQGVSLQEVQEKFHHTWLSWNREQPKSSEIKDLGKPEMESETLAMSRSIIQQLQDACQMLVSGIQGLPTNFQDKVKQMYHNMEELHASFSTAHSFQDLSSSLLTQSQEMVTKAQEYVDELMAYVMETTPLSWVVGPFIPLGLQDFGITFCGETDFEGYVYLCSGVLLILLFLEGSVFHLIRTHLQKPNKNSKQDVFSKVLSQLLVHADHGLGSMLPPLKRSTTETSHFPVILPSVIYPQLRLHLNLKVRALKVTGRRLDHHRPAAMHMLVNLGFWWQLMICPAILRVGATK